MAAFSFAEKGGCSLVSFCRKSLSSITLFSVKKRPGTLISHSWQITLRKYFTINFLRVIHFHIRKISTASFFHSSSSLFCPKTFLPHHFFFRKGALVIFSTIKSFSLPNRTPPTLLSRSLSLLYLHGPRTLFDVIPGPSGIQGPVRGKTPKINGSGRQS